MKKQIKEWSKNHSDYRRAYCEKWQQLHPEYFGEYQKELRKKNEFY